MSHEVWQDYDCPLSGTDFDLFEGKMVHKGQRFHCAGCGQDHTAGVDVQVSTYEDVSGSVFFPDLPETPEALQSLRDGTAVNWWGTGDPMTTRPLPGNSAGD